MMEISKFKVGLYKLKTVDWGTLSVFTVIVGFLIYFFVYPVVLVAIDAFRREGTFSLEYFVIYWSTRYYREGLINSLLLAFLSLLATTAIGVPLAYVFVRYNFPGKKLFSILSIIPMIIPPFVGALGLRFVLGRFGMINLILMQYLKLIRAPIPFLFQTVPISLFDNIFNIHLGMVLIETLHLYPVIYLNTAAALANLDPSLEEQAENLGASGFHLFRTVTLPLMLPGYLAGAILVFIWVLTDLGTPLVINYDKVISYQLFSEARVTYYQGPFVYVMSLVMTLVSLAAVALSRRYIGLREYARVQAGASAVTQETRLRGLKLVVCYVFLILLTLTALFPHIGIFFAAFTREWTLSVLPQSYTLENFLFVFSEATAYIKNSFLYSTIAMITNMILGAAIGYILVRKQIFGKGFLDYLSMLPLAIPGIVLGIGYWRAWMGTILNPFYVAGLSLVLSLTVRRLPFTVRAAHAGMLQIPKEYEEVSLNLGASRLRTFMRITIPLLIASVIAGGILSFTYAILEVSTTLILISRAQDAPITWAIFDVANNPYYGYNLASAMGLILIVVVVISLVIINKVFGKQMGALFRAG